MSVRLRVQAGDKVVRLLVAANLEDWQATAAMQGNISTAAGQLEFAAPYGEKAEQTFPVPKLPLQMLPGQRFLTAPVEVTAPLPPGPIDELMLRVSGGGYTIV